MCKATGQVTRVAGYLGGQGQAMCIGMLELMGGFCSYSIESFLFVPACYHGAVSIGIHAEARVRKGPKPASAGLPVQHLGGQFELPYLTPSHLGSGFGMFRVMRVRLWE